MKMSEFTIRNMNEFIQISESIIKEMNERIERLIHARLIHARQ